MPNGINPPYTRDSSAVSPGSYGSSEAVAPSPAALATCLFGADSAAVTGGEHSLHASLHDSTGGDKAPLVGLNDIFDESGIGIQPDIYERGCRE